MYCCLWPPSACTTSSNMLTALKQASYLLNFFLHSFFLSLSLPSFSLSLFCCFIYYLSLSLLFSFNYHYYFHLTITDSHITISILTTHTFSSHLTLSSGCISFFLSLFTVFYHSSLLFISTRKLNIHG